MLDVRVTFCASLAHRRLNVKAKLGGGIRANSDVWNALCYDDVVEGIQEGGKTLM
jgi:hypothetical protein